MVKNIKVDPKYVRIGMWTNGVLYMPEEDVKDTAVVVMHSDSDYLAFPAGPALASHGYATLQANVSREISELDKKLIDVKGAVEFVKKLDFVKHVVILGHSGGATLMSCYQAVAENGAKVFQDSKRIVKMSDVEELPAADACLFIDSNFGNGAMTLLSIDPAVMEEGCGAKLNPEYDTFSEASGFSAGNTHYTEKFKIRFYKAQAERNARLIDFALERLEALNDHRGLYFDDEPLNVAGGAQFAPLNKLFPQDTGLLAHTKKEYDLIHKGGTITHEVIRSLRKPRGDRSMTPVMGLGTMRTTVRTFITSNAVRTTGEFHVGEDGVYGIDYDSSYCCTPGNIRHIKAPTLIMGMTGGYEYLAAEALFENSPAVDKQIAFVEGASHMLFPAKECEEYEGQFGDTVATLFDYVAEWLEKRFQ